MKLVSDLQLGYTDAENYKRRENKNLLNQVFIRTEQLDRLCQPAISFLVGEKGTGKTAYSVYLANNDYKNTSASIKYLRETEYQTFVRLKKERHVPVSDYTAIWKTTLYLLMSQQVIAREGGPAFFQRFTKFAKLQAAINEYYENAFSPEIVQALQMVQESNIAADLIFKHAKAGASDKETKTFSESRFQINLFYIQRAFEEALGQLRLTKNHVIFIDGIDIRPLAVSYEDYLECIRGLANAVWEINNDFFPSINESSATRMRTVLLIRPDIFASIGLQNLNTKSRDNSVFLDWITDYAKCRDSEIFHVIDHLLASQQVEKLKRGQAWDFYFPWLNSSGFENRREETSFIGFLRFSYYRPRDIATMLTIMQSQARRGGGHKAVFSAEDFDEPSFRQEYSDYLLGEVKDQLMFYYTREDYETFLKFFEFLGGKFRFDWYEYTEAFRKYLKSVSKPSTVPPPFLADSTIFLQFLYDLNVICYIEFPESDRTYFRWCFRERSYGNISPRVKEECTYEVFYGLQKALNLGQKLSGRRRRQ